MKSSDYNTTDWQKYRKLMMTGILAALTALAGDMILGWGVCDESMSGFAYYFSRYMTVSEERIAIAAFLGMVGIPIECLCYYGIHGLIRNERYAGIYRIGLTGILIFGALVHVLCCIMVSYGKMCFMSDPVAAQNRIFRFGLYYLIPPCLIFFAFFITAAVIQFKAFSRGCTPYPKQCCWFSFLAGIVVIILMRFMGNQAWAYAVSTGWISWGSLFMFAGLLVAVPEEEEK